MEKTVFYYAIPLTGHVFYGKVRNISSLTALFQDWCRKFGLDDTESLCLWTAGRQSGSQNGLSEDTIMVTAHYVKHKLPESKAPVCLTCK